MRGALTPTSAIGFCLHVFPHHRPEVSHQVVSQDDVKPPKLDHTVSKRKKVYSNCQGLFSGFREDSKDSGRVLPVITGYPAMGGVG